MAAVHAARLPPNPGSGPSPHDPRQRLITAQARRRPSPPATGRSHPHPSNPPTWRADRTDIGRHAHARPHASPYLSSSLCRPSDPAPPANPPTSAAGNRQISIDARPGPAGSFPGGFRTPAPGAARYVSTSRHPKPFTRSAQSPKPNAVGIPARSRRYGLGQEAAFIISGRGGPPHDQPSCSISLATAATRHAWAIRQRRSLRLSRRSRSRRSNPQQAPERSRSPV